MGLWVFGFRGVGFGISGLEVGGVVLQAAVGNIQMGTCTHVYCEESAMFGLYATGA